MTFLRTVQDRLKGSGLKGSDARNRELVQEEGEWRKIAQLPITQ
jgi:hypothetical protein